MNKKYNDMTVGNPTKSIFYFSVPLIFSGLMQQFYNIADSVIVGNLTGVDGLAAVGAAFPILMLFISAGMGATSGSSVVISKLFGGKKISEMKTAVSTSVISLTVLGTVLVGIGLIFLNPIMNLLNVPADIYVITKSYLCITLVSVIALFMYSGAMGAFLGMGDSKTPLFLLIFASIFNVVLDYILVLKNGINGAAWATLIAQTLCGILSAVLLKRKVSKMNPKEKYKKFDYHTLKDIFSIALPSMIQQSIVSIGQLLVQGIVNGYGTSVVAGYSAAVKLNSVVTMLIGNMSNAVSNFTAQNIGAGKQKRVKEGFISGIKITLIFCIFIIIGIFMNTDGLIKLFVNDNINTEVIIVGSQFLRTVALFYIVLTFMMIANGVLRGAGNMKSFMISTMSDLIVRVVAAFILSGIIGIRATWISIPIGWVMGMLISIYEYKLNNKNILTSI